MRMHDLILDGARRHPDRPAVTWVDRARSLTYGDAAATMEQVGGALAALGVVPGDRVMVFAHNGLDYVLTMLGAWRIGAVAALVNVQYADTLDYYVNDCTPKVLVYTHDHLATLDRHRAAMPSIEHYVCFDGAQPGAHSWSDLLAAAPAAPPDTISDTAAAHLSYTSGTTGQPKGAVLGHEPTMRATACIAERLRIEPGAVTFGPTALSSSYQLVANLLAGWHRGGHVHVMGKWSQVGGWDALDACAADTFVANPTLLTDVLVESRVRGRVPQGLRVGVSGGGPVPPSLKRAWRDELERPLAESYGQSELGGFVGLGAPVLQDDTTIDAVGRPLPDKEVRVLDDDDVEVPVGQTGQLCIRGGFMIGYWNRSEKTAETTKNGWLHTGDVGSMDADGYVRLRGRLAERIVVRDVIWYPRDIEEAMLLHPAVRQCALVGVPDAERGQRPVAYVTVHDGPAPMGDALVATASGALGRDLSDVEVRIVDELPMTPTGKIAKAELTAMAAAPPA